MNQQPKPLNICTSFLLCQRCSFSDTPLLFTDLFFMYISAALLQSVSTFLSVLFLSALNLKLSVAPSAPVIANYLLQPQAMCWLASSNQTLLFSRWLYSAPKTSF